jgi:hypothetical protein
MEEYKFFKNFLWNFTQQFNALEVIFATKPPGLGLKGTKINFFKFLVKEFLGPLRGTVKSLLHFG